MATYIPGSQAYLPEVKAFTPDYKFLSNVLQTRTDRYTTNYEALSDLYGKVVYSDLSREDTREERDQYANALAPKIEKISGLDLSLQQNVDAAKAVFTPFFQNDLVVKDIVVTKQYFDQLNYANSLLKSPNDKQVEKYWDVGMKALKYQMQDFIDADAATALQMNAPQYVEDVDLYERSIELLNESGLFDDEVYGPPEFSPDGKWMIKTKGGANVSAPALVYLQRSLVDDPRVQRAYYTSAYVQQRETAENMVSSGAAPDMNSAQRMWANQTLAKAQEQLALEVEQKEGEVVVAQEQVASTQAYVDKYGEYALTSKGSSMAEALANLEASREGVNVAAGNLKTSSVYIDTEPEIDTETLLNRAYNMMMNVNIGNDLAAAAHTFGQSKLQVDIEVNPYKKLEIEHQNRVSLANLEHENRKREIDYENEQAAKDISANPWAPGGEDDIRQSNQGINILEGKQQIKENEEIIADRRVDVEKVQRDLLIQEKSLMGEDANAITVSVRALHLGPGKYIPQTMTRDEADVYYRNNPDAFAHDLVEFKELLEDGPASKNLPNYADQKITFEKDGEMVTMSRVDYSRLVLEGADKASLDIDEIEQQSFASIFNNLEVFTERQRGGDPMSRNVGVVMGLEGFPSIISRTTNPDGTERYDKLSLEEYQELVYNMTLADDDAIHKYEKTVVLPFGDDRGNPETFGWRDYGSLQRRIMDQGRGLSIVTGAMLDADAQYQSLKAQRDQLNSSLFDGTYDGRRSERFDALREIDALEEKMDARRIDLRGDALNKNVKARVFEEAEEAYNIITAAAEDGYTEYKDAVVEAGGDQDKVESSLNPFSAEAAFGGWSSDAGFSVYVPGIEGTFRAQSPPAVGTPVFNLVSEFATNLQRTPQASIFIHAGKLPVQAEEPGFFGGTMDIRDVSSPEDVIAQQVVNQIALDSYAWIERGTENAQPSDKAPVFDITRFEEYVHSDGREYLRYDLSVSNDYISSLTGDDDIIPKGTSSKYRDLTIVIDKNQAFQNESLSLSINDNAARELNRKGTIASTVDDGGSYSITKDNLGRISLTAFDFVFNPETGLIDTIPFPTEYIPGDIKLQGVVDDLRTRFSALASNNRDQMQLANNASNGAEAQ